MGPKSKAIGSGDNSLLSRRYFIGTTIFLGRVVGGLTIPKPIFAGAPRQANWRFCNKCEVLFFNGYPNKGSCATGGAHVAQGFNFLLPHDVAETSSEQRNWRFCNKCKAMFFDGFPVKGSCPAGGAHVAQGY